MKKESNRLQDFQNIYPGYGKDADGLVTVCFSYATSGWVQLWIATTASLQDVSIKLSDVFNPFPGIFHWLGAIAEGNLPAEMNIDEEGTAKTLYAAAAPEDDLVYFQIIDRYDNSQVLWGCRCLKRQLIYEFVTKFELFLRGYFPPDSWRFEPGPKDVDLSALKGYLAEKQR